MNNEWKPISRAQERFLALPDTIKEAFFGGSAGPGKSECLTMYPIVRGFIDNPNFKALFLRRTYGELKLEIIPRIIQRGFYKAFGGKFNKSDLVWEFPSGALIFFGHCEHESDVSKYDGMEINLFLPDEIESLTEYIYLYIGFTRVRSSDSTLPAIIRASGMPGGIGHTWVRKRFIEPAPKGSQLILGKGGNKRIFIFSTLADVIGKIPSLQEYADSLEVLPEAEKRAKKYGDWNAYEGQVFEEFRVKHYPNEPENALHVIESFAIPDWWPRIVVIDWGFAAMTWVGYGAISPTKRVYIYREQSWKRTKIENWAPFVKENLDNENVKVIKVCKSAGQDRGQEHTIQQQIETALGRGVQLSNNTAGSRIAGKMLLHEYLRWEQKHIPKKEQVVYDEQIAAWVLRNHGDTAYKNYLNQFNAVEQEDNLPKLLIFDTCEKLIDAIQSCVYDKTNPEDVAEFEGDDPYDGIRYLVDAADKYFDESKFEMEKLEKQDKIVKTFAETQDWNTLFAQARALENTQTDWNKPVKRFHHVR